MSLILKRKCWKGGWEILPQNLILTERSFSLLTLDGAASLFQTSAEPAEHLQVFFTFSGFLLQLDGI